MTTATSVRRGRLRAASARRWEQPAPRLVAFAAALVLFLGIGAGLGALVGPESAPAQPAPQTHSADPTH